MEAKLGPSEAFGEGNGYSRLVMRARKGHMLLNMNTGRAEYKSEPPMELVEAGIIYDDGSIKQIGVTLAYEFDCKDTDSLIGTLNAFLYIYPALLNVDFADPPVIEQIKVTIKDQIFQWEHAEGKYVLKPVTHEEVEKSVVTAMERMPLFSGYRNRRLAAATHYSYIASRLQVVGHSVWEFMAESILNWYKALVILFATESRDAIREQLMGLGYEEKEINSEFIPVMILRNFMDVSHPRLAIFKGNQFSILYKYLAGREIAFKELFTKVFQAIEDGQFEIKQSDDLDLDDAEQRSFDEFIESIKDG